jgi:hypothetical protein
MIPATLTLFIAHQFSWGLGKNGSHSLNAEYALSITAYYVLNRNSVKVQYRIRKNTNAACVVFCIIDWYEITMCSAFTVLFPVVQRPAGADRSNVQDYRALALPGIWPWG